ncbi:EAL domain-containing response regulator [Noviherbaspirillum galbum]|uniref:EAL domain-containing response regulator n=1 Tax=Noviherbaspirillum galbum TaxID=2709383 RepID=A0A6B3SRU2_9BURK|nr:EAL domain-containing response regulator [Noviherbaspirillum galbum]NEX63473.1 EAL domain-containing response regulator [Noviherbaspirillum galbum]
MQDEQHHRIGGLRFLVAEDDEFQRHWLTVMLTKLGATHITEAQNGREALKILSDASSRIDISFVDLNMPGMDGIELVRHLANGEHAGAVALTSALGSALLFSVETMSKAYGIDVLGTFEKPATPEVLERLIGNYKPSSRARGDAQQALPQFSLDDIHAALAQNQFEPFFQPKVELATGKVKAVEAFARWRHPAHGILTPKAFIPVLEQSGSMERLTWRIIERSVAACRSWHDRGLMLSVSINLSATALSEAGLAERILAHIHEHGIEPAFLTIEITELMAMTDSPVCLENLARLRMKGFGLSVDDYGTARSNMQQLLRIPFLDLKIDRSFVAGAAQNEQMRIALSSCLDLARKLRRNSVAVGVETREDWDLLRGLGCTYAQGFYIAKPMEREAVPDWIDEWNQFF